MSNNRLTRVLDGLSSNKPIKYAVYTCSIIFFLAIILIPPLLGIILKWNLMGQIFEFPELASKATNAIYASFGIALLVSLIDVIAGLPMAWLIARGRSRWMSVIDTLADIPFIIPTATLGYSMLLFWSRPEGISSLFSTESLIAPGWILVVLLHFTFSYPVIVRVMVGALMDYRMEFEEAARTLGAAPLTADRTVTLAILKPSLIAAFTLAFARSISETGATMMVVSINEHIMFYNGPIFIADMKSKFREGLIDENLYKGSMVFVSFILISISCLIFAVIRLLGPKLRFPVKRVWPNLERKLSSSVLANLRNATSLIIFFFLILIPSLFVALPALNAILSGVFTEAISSQNIWAGYWDSLLLSYLVGGVVTVINMIIGLPMAVMIARKTFGKKVSAIFDILTDIPIIVPSVALGASLSIFWRENFAFIPEIWLLIFAHLSITYSYFVRSMAAAIERVNIDLEEAARILGARPFAVFRTIILPLTKYSLFSGAIMVFTRSVDETGATLAVVTTLKTAPVLLVDWVKQKVPATPLEIGLACGFLISFSFVILLILRALVRGKEKY